MLTWLTVIVEHPRELQLQSNFSDRLRKLHDDRNHVNIDAHRNLHDHDYRHVARFDAHDNGQPHGRQYNR